jgi:hypothetical protein
VRNAIVAAQSGALAVDALGLGTDAVYHVQYGFAHDAATVDLTFAAVLSSGSKATWGLDNVRVYLDTVAGVTSTKSGSAETFHGAKGLAGDVGCADGAREAFLDQGQYPDIAGCEATWPGTISMRAPATGIACGDTIGACAAPADACAGGWHLCGVDGSISELRTLSAVQCADAGEGQFFSASSHCTTQATSCTIDLTSAANYPCFDSGWCSEPVCCGNGCAHYGICTNGVWAGWTHIGPSGCNAMSVPKTGQGVMCCRNH